MADPSGRSVYGVGLLPLTYCNSGFGTLEGGTDVCLLWMLLLSGRGLCLALITHAEESYRVWCVWVSSRSIDNEENLTKRGLSRHRNKQQCGYCAYFSSRDFSDLYLWLICHRKANYLNLKFTVPKRLKYKIKRKEHNNILTFWRLNYCF